MKKKWLKLVDVPNLVYNWTGEIICRQTAWRWCTTGRITTDGERIVLPFKRVGEKIIFVAEQDLRSFLERL